MASQCTRRLQIYHEAAGEAWLGAAAAARALRTRNVKPPLFGKKERPETRHTRVFGVETKFEVGAGVVACCHLPQAGHSCADRESPEVLELSIRGAGDNRCVSNVGKLDVRIELVDVLERVIQRRMQRVDESAHVVGKRLICSSRRCHRYFTGS